MYVHTAWLDVVAVVLLILANGLRLTKFGA